MNPRLWWSYADGDDARAEQLRRWQHPTAGWVITVCSIGRAGVTSKKTYKLKANRREYDVTWEIPV